MSKNLRKRIYTSFVLFFILFLTLINNYALGYFLIVARIFSILEFIRMILIILEKDKIKKFFVNLFFITYIFTFCIIFLIFSSFLHLKILIFVILITCIASDIGGFMFGKILKGPKLSKISPNKTISGAMGSLIFSSIIALLIIYYLTKNLDFYMALVGCLTSISCQIGDLFFSFLKRKSRLKDTSNFLPGHGGVLDRIDGMLIGIPVGFFTLLLFY